MYRINQMTAPELLRQGDLIAVTAASGPCDGEKLAAGVKALEAMGLRVRVMDSCCARHGYLAGSDDMRLHDLHAVFVDKDVRGIFMARGGYGAARLLPRIDFAMIKRNPKVFVGFSDVTALHLAINQRCGLITFHGPMPAAGLATADEYTLESLKNAVFVKPEISTLKSLKGGLGGNYAHVAGFAAWDSHFQKVSAQGFPSNPTSIVPGCCEGLLTGGNLTIMAASLGTPYEIETRGRILFIEETQEEPYRVDRLFLQLKQASKFRDASGIVLGDFGPETLESLSMAIEELIIPEKKPTIGGLSCGHTGRNLTLPLGARAVISTESEHPLQIYGRLGTGAARRRP